MSSMLSGHDQLAEHAHLAVEATKRLIANAKYGDAADHEKAAQQQLWSGLERLQLWMNDHNVIEGQLDRKLELAPSLRHRVLLLLKKVQRVAVHEETARNADTTGSSVQSTEHRNHLPSTSSEPPEQSEDASQFEAGTETSTASSSGIDTNLSFDESLSDSPADQIDDSITQLLALGPSLLNPATQYSVQQELLFDAAQPDLDYVGAKFPKASQNLVDRFGRANWERRVTMIHLRSKAEQQAELRPPDFSLETSLQYDGKTLAPEVAAQPCIEFASDNQSRWQQSRSLSSGVGKGVSIFDDSGLGSMTASKTQYSAIQTQEPQAVVDFTRGPRTSLPPYPVEARKGEKFQCPFCFEAVSDITSLGQWRKHVLEDLQPYLCTFVKCDSPTKMYASRALWWEHESEYHRPLWSWCCTPCTRAGQLSTFDTAGLFDDHLKEHHPLTLTDAQLHSIRQLCQQRTGTAEPNDRCPFCTQIVSITDENQNFERTVRNHIADHMEQLVFFVACPVGQTNVDYADEDGLIDDSDSEVERAEVESIITDDRFLTKQEVRLANVSRFMKDQEQADGIHGMTSALTRPTVTNTNSKGGGDTPEPLSESDSPIRVLMHPPNEHFYGRETLITDSKRILDNPGSICVYHGVGGIGKTLAAVEYVYRYQEQFDAIFWLQADTAPGLSDSYLQMVTSLGLLEAGGDHMKAIDRGRYWLEHTKKRWLLVFDNVISYDEISPYMPALTLQANGSILITTHHKDLLRDAPNVTKLCLKLVDQEAGAEMLLRYLGKDVDTDPERDLAREISVFVGGLPVAIAHLAGYAQFSAYTLEELIETFREWRVRTGAATMEADDLPAAFREATFSYDETLAMVWNVTLRELSADAQNIMYILSYLNSEAVPESMLFTIREENCIEFPDSREPRRMRIAKKSLISRRLVQTHNVNGENFFSIHRSLQRGIRENLSHDLTKQQLVFMQAVALVREVFPRSNPLQQPMPDKWADFQRLLPHLHALRDVYHKNRPQIRGSPDFAQLLQDAGVDQFERGVTREGLILLETAEQVLESLPHEEYEAMRADIHAMIAMNYDNTGVEKRADAMRRRKIALEIRKKVADRNSPPRRMDEILLFNSWMEYAIALLHYNRYREAEPVIERCLAKFREWGPEDEIPFEYAKYYNKIGLVRMYQGRFAEAMEHAARGAQLMRQTGYDVFETRFRFDLACIILQSGDVDRAMVVHQEIYEWRRAKLGVTNELTRHSQYAMGVIHEMQGDLGRAEQCFRKALNQFSISPWSDEAYARAQFRLARVLSAQGRPDDVETSNILRKKALKVLHQLLPLDVPPELRNVTDETVLFDHVQTIMGARFTGRDLLKFFMQESEDGSQ